MNETQRVTQMALDAFWREVARHYPEATSGDVLPSHDIALQRAAEVAVAGWVNLNVPTEG